MSIVGEVLKTKGGTVWSVSPLDTVLHTLELMAEKNIGAVIVLKETKVAGIFSERDFARHSARHRLNPAEILVKDMMTTHIFCVSPQHTVEECMSVMTNKHIRHLPVMEGEKIVGLISIGDVVNRVIRDHKFSINQLERYITREP